MNENDEHDEQEEGPYVERSPREHRDEYLVVTSVIGAAVTLRTGYEDWLVEEANELLAMLAMIKVFYTGNPTLTALIEARQQRLMDIAEYEIKDAVKAANEKITDVENNAYDDAYEARRYIDDGIYRLDRLVHEVLLCRRFVDDIDEQKRLAEGHHD